MNLPDIKSALFGTVLFANKPNKLKAVRSVMRCILWRAQTDVQMSACSQQAWQGGGASRTRVWWWSGACTSQIEPLRVAQDAQDWCHCWGSIGTVTYNSFKESKGTSEAGVPKALSVLPFERWCCVLVLTAYSFLIVFLSVEFGADVFPHLHLLSVFW